MSKQYTQTTHIDFVSMNVPDVILAIFPKIDDTKLEVRIFDLETLINL